MMTRVRRWWRHCQPRSAMPGTRFRADMRSARAYGVVEQRGDHRAIRRLQDAIAAGATEYREINRTAFGRDPWQERGKS